MTLTEVKEMADTQFETFMVYLHADYPEFVLKYQINKTMKVDFIEAVIRQVWVGQSYDKIDILDFMVNRGTR